MKKLIFIMLIAISAVSAVAFIRESGVVKWSAGLKDMPDTADAQQIMRTIQRAYELEAKAACTFDISEFPTVFINDPRGGALDPSTAEFVRDVLNGPSLPAPGYLDYKVAYYQWWAEGAARWEALQARAAAEGRNLTQDEMASLVDSKGRMAGPRGCPGPEAGGSKIDLEFLSLHINGDVASVVFDDGPRTNQMTLVKVNHQWYIAGNRILALHP